MKMEGLGWQKAETGSDKPRTYNGDYMELGKLGEGQVLRWLQSNTQVIGVDDLRDLRPMQTADVDCSIHLTDGRVHLAEIKTDSWLGKSDNMIFEVLRINHTAAPDLSCVLGWSAKSPARWIIWYAPAVNSIYLISSDDFRKAMQAYTNDNRASITMDYTPTDKIKSTVSILVPSRYWKSYTKIYKLGAVTQ